MDTSVCNLVSLLGSVCQQYSFFRMSSYAEGSACKHIFQFPNPPAHHYAGMYMNPSGEPLYDSFTWVNEKY